MSRTAPAPRARPSTHQEPAATYKLFIWDLGTDSRQPSDSSIRTLAAVEYSSQTPKVAHFSTSIRPQTVATKHATPTFPDAWNAFSSFIADHSQALPPLLVSHNAAFDVTVLLAELRRANITVPSTWRFACSLLLSRSVHPFAFDNSQLALAARLGVVVNSPHHTPEDVVVLREILLALDQKALRDHKPANRVVPALCDHARTPAFFDRTPQFSSNPDADASPKFFITSTGTRYHRQGCKWLHRSSIPRDAPPPGFRPCRVCRPDNKNFVIPDKPSTEHKSSADISREKTTSDPKQVFVTKSGTKYHVEGCKWLSRSKIPKDTPPPGYKPCRTCINDISPSDPVAVQDRHKPRSSSASSSSNVSETESSEKAPFYITKTGRKYHLDGCKSLARSRLPKEERPSGYEPCGICWPNIAYTGSPQVKKVPA